jgi:23S rRNA-/tRNA-specific pseudouridylate synthase
VFILAETADDYIVLKPAGMPTEMTSDPDGITVKARLPQPNWLVHRLDRVTRGVLLVARTKAAAAFHGASFAERRVTKLYLARVPMVAGLVGAHRAYLKEHTHWTEIVRSGGRPSFLDVLAVAPAPGRRGEAHALVQLHTGRRHQVRVMLAMLGAPLVGDTRYDGKKGDFYLEHALLRFPGLGGGERVAHLAEDPEREELDPEIAGVLLSFL